MVPATTMRLLISGWLAEMAGILTKSPGIGALLARARSGRPILRSAGVAGNASYGQGSGFWAVYHHETAVPTDITSSTVKLVCSPEVVVHGCQGIMGGAIDFNHQPTGGAEEINYVVANRMLANEGVLATSQCAPQFLLPVANLDSFASVERQCGRSKLHFASPLLATL